MDKQVITGEDDKEIIKPSDSYNHSRPIGLMGELLMSNVLSL
jgi:hypothetical protein